MMMADGEAIDQIIAPGVHFLQAEPHATAVARRSHRNTLGHKLFQEIMIRVIRRGMRLRETSPTRFARFVARWRRFYMAFDRPFLPMMDAEAVRDVEPEIARHDPPGVPAEWFAPKRGASRGVVFYVHGGSFICERSPRITGLVGRFAATAKARVFAPNYRLAPEHPCPAAVEDVVDAYRWHRRNWPDEPIVALAESAGAAILTAALQRLRDGGDPLPGGIVLLSPWLDLSLQGWSLVAASLAGTAPYAMESLAAMAHLYLQGGNAADPVASPLFGNFDGFPPILIHASKSDVLFDDAERLADRIRATKGNLTVRFWEDETHVWERLKTPRARQSIQLAAQFIRDRLDAGTPRA